MQGNKRDPYNSKEKWEAWIKNPQLDGLKYNSDLIIQFLKDFEQGKNISVKSKKGQRSHIRLMALKSRLNFFSKQWSKKKFTSLNKDDVHLLFSEMRDGVIKKSDGKTYNSVGSYVKDWKCFYHWLKKTGKVETDINEELDRADSKPAWTYLNEEQFKTLLAQSSADYRPLIALMLDSGARVTEAYNIRVSDFENDFTKLTIRAETSKNNYERTINLKICTGLIKDYIKFYDLKGNDFIFLKHPPAFNKYLREKCVKLFGDVVSHPKAKGKFSEMSLYSIRHIASCYWLKRYQNHRGLMYRMAWTSERWIKYYSEFLGQNDEITDDDMITKEDQGKLEKQQKEIEELKRRFEEYIEAREETDVSKEFFKYSVGLKNKKQMEDSLDRLSN